MNMEQPNQTEENPKAESHMLTPEETVGFMRNFIEDEKKNQS